MAAVAAKSEPSGLQNISTLLETLNTCLSNTGSSLPLAKRENPTDVSIEPPQEGISLLDTKNDLLLSYLQNLVFLVIFQLREVSSSDSQSEDDTDAIRDDVVKKLVELRVYLDRGVRPLEARLKYQVDKVIKAAEDAERAGQAAPKKKTKQARGSDNEDESGSDEDSSDSEGDSDEEDEDMDDMAFRPNISAFGKGAEPQARPEISAKNADNDGIYRPPKIMPTALPTTERRERAERRPQRSNVIDEFVNSEMSSAPMAEASIGSTIRQGGRYTKSKKDREHEAEREAYEEANFIRLPKESKKDLAKRGAGGRGQSGYGGEDWRGLTEGADRISKLTRRAKGSGGVLEKSRKRKNEDGQRDDGVGPGQMFDKRRKKIDSWKR